ncbi:MAG: winged helix-turn-helix transcriptional regulator [Desulfobacteraceae bacterium]|nr:winged helix-turn-helix transcriptional regulator [Desulfobacteraceae bacterium]
MYESLYMETTQKIDAFKAIGDATRFRILKLLSENRKLCVTALANKLEIAQPTVSQHLKILKIARLVQSERIGTHIHYTIEPATLKDLAQQIDVFSKPPIHKCVDMDCHQKK